jgi:glucoamylase
MSESNLEYRWIDGQGPAFGSPGISPRWTSSEKNTVCTAYSASSRIWFTTSHGILNEVFYPTIDRPQIRDLGLLITDGETFMHEEKRDLDKQFGYLYPEAPAPLLTNSDPQGRYTITKEIISDPHASVVLMRVRFHGDEAFLSKLKVYVLLAPHLEVGGAGNSARTVDISGRRVFLAWRGDTSLAMTTDCGFDRTSCGYAGTSDGFQDVKKHFKMEWEFGSALDGNLGLTGEISLKDRREFVLALGFGQGHHAALTSTLGSINRDFDSHEARFRAQWSRVNGVHELDAQSGDGGKLLRTSHNMLLVHEDKTFSGAFIASASIPWGQAAGDDDLGGYHLVWTRDMVQSASALLAANRAETALRALTYLECTQKPDGGFAQNFWVNGQPYWSGMQLDEVAFPIMLAWRLWKIDALGRSQIVPFVERAAGYLVRHAPITQQERWEENSGYSPSTLAAVISGLVCAAEIIRDGGMAEQATFLEEYADWIESHLEDWTVTNDGVLHPEVKRHYMRVRPPAPGEQYARDDAAQQIVQLNNREPGEQSRYEAREIIDAGFLELVRYGIRRADDPLMIDSLKVVDKIIKIDTKCGPCWRRYNHDGYGQRKDGGPYRGYGQGRPWPLLIGERAHYELAAGNDVKPLIKALEAFASPGGMLPEQIWDAADIPEKGMYFGRPSGSAMPLVWAHAEYLKLLRSAHDGRVFDRIAVVEDRYISDRAKHVSKPLVEVWTFMRQAHSVEPGRRLRLLADQPFELVWTADGWASTNHVNSSQAASSGHFADVPTEKSQTGRIEWTFFWPQDHRWEGRNFSAELESPKAM